MMTAPDRSPVEGSASQGVTNNNSSRENYENALKPSNAEKLETRARSSSPDIELFNTTSDRNWKLALGKNLRLNQQSEPCGPSSHIILRLLFSFLCLFISWSILYTILRDAVLPGSQLLALIVLSATSYIAGDLSKLFGLPKFPGMLLSGILMRNMGLFFDNREPGVYSELVSVTRLVALTCVLINASLELDVKLIKKFSVVVLELAFVPCVAEAIGVAVGCKLLLNFSWIWAMLAGFTMGAVSPAVVVPSLIKLQRRGCDPEKKISTIVIAAASFNDTVAILGYGIFSGMIFDQGFLFDKMIHIPLEIAFGLIVGILWAVFAAWVPHPSDHHLVTKRVFMIGGGGVMFVLGSRFFGYDRAGPLACMVATFAASICWKWQGWSSTYNPVKNVFGSLWNVLQPVLVGLVGIEIDFTLFHLSQAIEGFAIIFGGLVARAIGCTAVLITTGVTWKQLLFMNIAWVPKATVQAVLGPLAFDRARRSVSLVSEDINNGQLVLMMAVISILLTSPLGSLGINLLGPKLMKPDGISAEQNRIPELRPLDTLIV